MVVFFFSFSHFITYMLSSLRARTWSYNSMDPLSAHPSVNWLVNAPQMTAVIIIIILSSPLYERILHLFSDLEFHFIKKLLWLYNTKSSFWQLILSYVELCISVIRWYLGFNCIIQTWFCFPIRGYWLFQSSKASLRFRMIRNIINIY